MITGKRFVVSALAIVSAACSFRQTVIQRPDIHFDGTVVNAGMLLQGAVYTHRFVFRNRGASDLTLSNVQADCHCTGAVVVAKTPLRTGDVGSIDVSFDSFGELPGPFEKHLDVTSNDPAHPIQRLTLSGTVVPEFVFSQAGLEFHRGTAGERATLRVNVDPAFGVTITAAESSQAGVSATVSPVGDTSHVFEVTAVLDGPAPRFMMGNVTVKTTSTVLPEIAIPIRVRASGL